eukprot:COSAG02_NODE_11361_length_1740_cov_0.827544_2_plen_499_part_01
MSARFLHAATPRRSPASPFDPYSSDTDSFNPYDSDTDSNASFVTVTGVEPDDTPFQPRRPATPDTIELSGYRRNLARATDSGVVTQRSRRRNIAQELEEQTVRTDSGVVALRPRRRGQLVRKTKSDDRYDGALDAAKRLPRDMVGTLAPFFTVGNATFKVGNAARRGIQAGPPTDVSKHPMISQPGNVAVAKALGNAALKSAKLARRGIVAGAKASATLSNTAPRTLSVAPLVRTTSSAVGALGRTASKALASLPAAVDIRGEDDNPANVIGAEEKSSDDMPPKRGSDLRPEVARAELQRLYEQFAPAKLDENPNFIDDLLDKYQGRYGELLKRVRYRYIETLSPAVSAPLDPNATPRKAAQTVTSAQIEAGPATPGSAARTRAVYGTQTPPAATPTPVRTTSRNGSQLVHVDSNASFLSTLSHGERPSGLPPTTSVAGEPRGLVRLSSRSGSDGPDRTISAPVRSGDFQQPVQPEGTDGPDRTISAPVRSGDFQQPVA